MGLRLRVRCLRKRAATEMPDGHRRIYPRMPGHRRGWKHSLGTSDRSAVAPRQRTGRAALSSFGQRPGFVSKALLRWATNESLGITLIDPSKPWQNGMFESFNGKFRDECLSMEWFRSRMEAKAVIEDWRRQYNEIRPHSSLGKMTPSAFAAMNPNNLNRRATLKN